MNKVMEMGRLVADPTINHTEEGLCIARYRIAVPRRGDKDKADFISCVAFGKGGEFAEKYLHKGMKIALEGHIQTGSYEDRDGKKVYTTEVVAENQEFAESKSESRSETKCDEFVPAIEEKLPFI